LTASLALETFFLDEVLRPSGFPVLVNRTVDILFIKSKDFLIKKKYSI